MDRGEGSPEVESGATEHCGAVLGVSVARVDGRAAFDGDRYGETGDKRKVAIHVSQQKVSCLLLYDTVVTVYVCVLSPLKCCGVVVDTEVCVSSSSSSSSCGR